MEMARWFLSLTSCYGHACLCLGLVSWRSGSADEAVGAFAPAHVSHTAPATIIALKYEMQRHSQAVISTICSVEKGWACTRAAQAAGSQRVGRFARLDWTRFVAKCLQFPF